MTGSVTGFDVMMGKGNISVKYIPECGGKWVLSESPDAKTTYSESEGQGFIYHSFSYLVPVEMSERKKIITYYLYIFTACKIFFVFFTQLWGFTIIKIVYFLSLI